MSCLLSSAALAKTPGLIPSGPYLDLSPVEQGWQPSTVTAIVQSHDGYLWLGTYNGGLNRFDPVSGTFTHLGHDAREPGSLDSDRVYAIYEDRSGDLWVGTASGITR